MHEFEVFLFFKACDLFWLCPLKSRNWDDKQNQMLDVGSSFSILINTHRRIYKCISDSGLTENDTEGANDLLLIS